MDKQQIEYIEKTLKERFDGMDVKEILARTSHLQRFLKSHEDKEVLLVMAISDHINLEVSSVWRMKGSDLSFLSEFEANTISGHLAYEHGVYFFILSYDGTSQSCNLFSRYPDTIRILSRLSKSLVNINPTSTIWRKLIREEDERPKSILHLPIDECST
jgi:hypothetical protein